MTLEKAATNAATAQKAVDSADKIINTTNPEMAQKQEQHLKRLRTRAKAAFTRWATAQERVLILEDGLKILHEDHWKTGNQEYEDMLSELMQQEYRLAIDNLERLVIQRLFELTKLSMSGLGASVPSLILQCYKLRKKIGKALKARADAIKTALNEYNWCTTKLKQPMLSWNDVIDMVTLAEFDLLRETHEDIRQFPWAQRINWQAMNLYFNVKRTREEIERLNVEIPRTFTALVNCHYDLQLVIASVKPSDPALAHELQMQWAYEDKISARISTHLYETSQLAGFSRWLVAGKCAGQDIIGTEHIGLPSWACHVPQPGPNEVRQGEEESDKDKEDGGLPGADSELKAGLFVDFIDNLGQNA